MMEELKQLTPVLLPGSFWGITAFYNPAGYRNKCGLYRIFRENSKKQGLNLLTVELVFDKAPFELGPADAEILIQIRGDKNNILWQKERLLNIALENLPVDCDKISWLDGDILFKNNDWITQTSRLLEQFAVVQPFSLSVRLPRGVTDIDLLKANDKIYEKREGVAYSFTHHIEDFLNKGHSGFAWAARRSIFTGIGFYDRMILGGGDTILLCGFLGNNQHKFTGILPPKVNDDHMVWINEMFDRVRANVGYTDGDLMHLWHGESRWRLTRDRLKLLGQYHFDPSVDIKMGANACWEWATPKEEFHRQVQKYFWFRNEAGSLMMESWLLSRGALKNIKRMILGIFKGINSSLRKIPSFLMFCWGVLRIILSQGLHPNDKKLSVVILNWHRFELLKQIVEKYSNFSFVGDIVVWNNNKDVKISFENKKNVKVVNCSFDHGLDSRFAAGLLCESEFILFHDDDLIVSEQVLAFLFQQALKDPAIIHSLHGRNVASGYNTVNAYGQVDVVLTRAQILNQKYIRPYFEIISMFDYIRRFTCGNGEDIIMNYLVRHLNGRKNRAYMTLYKDWDRLQGVFETSIQQRPFHLAIRNEITNYCKFLFTKELSIFYPDQNLVLELKKNMIANNSATIYLPGRITKGLEGYDYSKNIKAHRLLSTLSLFDREMHEFKQNPDSMLLLNSK